MASVQTDVATLLLTQNWSMNETLGRGYARIEAIRAARGETPGGEEPGLPAAVPRVVPNVPERGLPAAVPRVVPNVPEPGLPPTDKHNTVYMTLFIAGAAFLLPFNSFIMAVDYFQAQYPESRIMFDMSTVYISSACVAVLVNNLLVDLFSYNTRITFGIVVSISTMVVVAWSTWLGPARGYGLQLAALALLAVGCTAQQASYYGLAGCLPPRYTQAVMAGESAAGFWVSLDRIVTKYVFTQARRSTLMFFVFSILVLVAHAALHRRLMKHPLLLHHLKLAHDSRQRRRIHLHLNPNEDVTLMESEAGGGSYGVLKLQSPVSHGEAESTTAFSFSNPVYSPTAPSTVPVPAGSPRPSYKVEDVVFESSERLTSWRAFKHGVSARWSVARAIYPHMVSIGLVYFTTLSLYPGIASEVPSCQLGTWMPIVLMSSFNLFDLLGKIAAAWPYEWSRSQLLTASGLRLLLVPLMLLCCAPRHSPHIVGDMYPIMFSVVLGFSNGLFGSVPMIVAPSRVAREHREIAGNMMTLSYNGGLLSGALVSYLLLGMLGPPSGAPCRLYPTPELPTKSPHTNLSHLY